LQVAVTTNFNGTLTLAQTSGLTIGGGTNGGAFMSIHGKESDINAALDGMTFSPANGYTGPVSIDVRTSLGADLQGRYEFSGDTRDTSLGLTQDGTAIGGATTTPDGIRGDVLLLDAAGEHVEVNSRFNEPADVTLAAWVNLDTSTDNAEIISLGNNLMLRADDSANGLTLGYYQGGSWNFVGAPEVNLDGTGWHHVAGVFDDTGNNIVLYLDGEQVARVNTSNNIDWTVDANTSTNTIIGAHGKASAGFDFQGRIDDARIYNRALTAGEVAAIAGDQTVVTDTIPVTVTEVNDAPNFGTPVSTLDASPTFIESGSPVRLDLDVQIFDAELSGADDFGGATLSFH